ncbi:MAG TPA: TVP38/TMEM64 family protein [Negativicutes bacterium]|nr:TVP38/TMEM64 family protein [Negativicutes bacterium]
MNLRTVSAAVILMGFIALHILYPRTFEEFSRLLGSGNAELTAAYIRGFGGWAVVVSICLSIIMTFGLIIPFVVLSAANGLVFGLGWGTAISWAGEVVGAVVAFGLYRCYFRPSVMQHCAHRKYWRYIDKIGGEHGFLTVLTGRVFPLVPSGVLTAAASVSTISFWDFTLATVIGKVPSVFVKVWVGHDLFYFADHKVRFMGGLLLLILLYAGAWWMGRREW